MSKIINVGKVTAYADAVAGGYQGTREEWEAALAGIGQEATAALAAKEGAEAAQAAAETAQGSAETAGAVAAASAQAAAASAADAHTDALAATAAKEGAEAAQTLAGQAAAAAAGSAGTASTAQVGAEAAQTAAETAASAAATSAEGAALSEDAAAASAQAAAGSAEDAQEVLDSIPEDYSELSGDVADLKSAITDVQGALYQAYTLADLTVSGSYIDSSGSKITTTLALATSPMFYVKGLKKVLLTKIGQTMSGQSVAFYKSPSFDSTSFISGYVSGSATETNTVINAPAGTNYIAFGSRTATGATFSATLIYESAEIINSLQINAGNVADNLTDLNNESVMLDDYCTELENIINYPTTTTALTNPARIFAIGKAIESGYYNITFKTSVDVTLYIFGISAVSDTSLTLAQKITKTPVNGTASFNTIKITGKSLIALSGRVGYNGSANGYYVVTYSDNAYTKAAVPNGYLDFNIKVDKINTKINDTGVSGIPYIATSASTTHIKLLGDSITQGSGSTGFVEFNLNGRVYRGNAPDYPSAGPDYQVGEYLGARIADAIYWYEALDGSGWGQLIKAYLENKFNCVVKDYGMGGATTTDILNCWDNIIDDDDDIVIIMMGTNDRRYHTLSTFSTDLTTIANNLITTGKRVIFMSAPPILASVDVSSQYFHMEDACNYTSAVAYNTGCQFIDNFNYLQNYCTYTGVNLGTLLNVDGIHPTDNGYKILLDNILANLRLGRKVDGATW